ncbi:MAG: DUF3800 domain-containing protein [Xanthobacteraceae bacterium]
MSDLTKPPQYYYIACIDEAGDPGIRRVRPLDPNGGSEWLVLGCSLIQVKSESDQVLWVRNILDKLRLKQQTVLHFRELDEWRKPLSCQLLGDIQDVRLFAMLSNKKNMKGHRNIRAASRSEGIGIDQVFYNWCLRIILERVTDFVFRHSIRTYGEPRHVKIVLGERGTHSYARATWYAQMLKDQSKKGTTYIDTRTINWQVFDSRLIEVSQPKLNAGLQLADIVASSFFQGVDILPPTIFNTNNARLLRPRIAEKDGTLENFGVTFLPFNYHEATLRPEQIDIFEFFCFHRFDFHSRP